MKIFVMTAVAAVFFSTAALANNITIKCDNDVERGSIKLTDPLTMHCEDCALVKKYLGSGVTVGPDSDVNDLVATFERLQKKPSIDKFVGLDRYAEWFALEDEHWINLKVD